jgi:hypothetical protein
MDADEVHYHFCVSTIDLLGSMKKEGYPAIRTPLLQWKPAAM